MKRKRFVESCQLLEKQLRFLNTLIIHPEYGKHVRLLEETVFVLSIIERPWRGWRLAMQSLMHFQHVDFDF